MVLSKSSSISVNISVCVVCMCKRKKMRERKTVFNCITYSIQLLPTKGLRLVFNGVSHATNTPVRSTCSRYSNSHRTKEQIRPVHSLHYSQLHSILGFCSILVALFLFLSLTRALLFFYTYFDSSTLHILLSLFIWRCTLLLLLLL